jgi:glyoxylase-like metal-dependent hydrolase (beta-lactamase superfamily II)
VADVEQCVNTHLHSDHVGNIRLLAPGTQLVLAEAETLNTAGSGRLPQKLPQDRGRILFTKATILQPVFEGVYALTAQGDVRVINTPGHTVGHSSVLVDLGEKQVLVAGDCAFADRQVTEGSIPGITENLSLLWQTYARLRVRPGKADHDALHP